MRRDVPENHYDVVIIGAGIAGSALAYALSSRSTDTTHKCRSRARRLRVALIERSLSKPDRIVVELFQPGGILALRDLGLGDCIEGIGAIPVRGYCVVEGERQVRVPYPDGFEGRSFHHGELVMTLGEKALNANGVDVTEAVVTELIEESASERIVGVRCRTKDASNAPFTRELRAKVVIVADGSAKQVPQPAFAAQVEPRLILVQSYSSRDTAPCLGHTRMLIDVKDPLPADMKVATLDSLAHSLESRLESLCYPCLATPYTSLYALRTTSTSTSSVHSRSLHYTHSPLLLAVLPSLSSPRHCAKRFPIDVPNQPTATTPMIPPPPSIDASTPTCPRPTQSAFSPQTTKRRPAPQFAVKSHKRNSGSRR